MLTASIGMVRAAENSSPDRITLSADTQLATEGYFVLSWGSNLPASPPPSPPYLLQMSTDTAFEAGLREYRGMPEREVTLSGLANGEYHFRVRSQDSDQWSNTLTISVAHHSLARALGFFSLGLGLFLAPCLSILLGARHTQALGKD